MNWWNLPLRFVDMSYHHQCRTCLAVSYRASLQPENQKIREHDCRSLVSIYQHHSQAVVSCENYDLLVPVFRVEMFLGHTMFRLYYWSLQDSSNRYSWSHKATYTPDNLNMSHSYTRFKLFWIVFQVLLTKLVICVLRNRGSSTDADKNDRRTVEAWKSFNSFLTELHHIQYWVSYSKAKIHSSKFFPATKMAKSFSPILTHAWNFSVPLQITVAFCVLFLNVNWKSTSDGTHIPWT